MRKDCAERSAVHVTWSQAETHSMKGAGPAPETSGMDSKSSIVQYDTLDTSRSRTKQTEADSDFWTNRGP